MTIFCIIMLFVICIGYMRSCEVYSLAVTVVDIICSHKYTNLCYVVVVFFFRFERYKGGIILFKRLFYSYITALYDTLWMWLSLEADRLYEIVGIMRHCNGCSWELHFFYAPQSFAR